MKNSSFRRFWIALLSVFCIATLHGAAQTGLVISQAYGGGGNSGAPYTYDYLEIYNPTAADISLSGYSVQYASATGSSWNAVALPSVTVAAGHYFLIQGAAGTGTPGNLPVAPDFVMATSLNQSGIPNFSATSGKIALVGNATPLSGVCPTGGGIVDFLGYGTANCSESAPAPAASNTTAEIRKDPAIDTNNNSADFLSGPPNPHNSTYGSGGGALAAVGSANPTTVFSGSLTLLTVAVTPGSSPASSGIVVQADLSAIGGSATQVFYDDGTHGDASAADNVFSFSTIATTGSNGAVSLPVTVTDTQARTATASISLVVNQPLVNTAIHTIQGPKSLTATTVSSYAGKQVLTTGIVTGAGSAGFFIQAKDSDADGDATTPEGIYVFTGSGKVPASAVVGNEVQVVGTVSTYPAVTASHTPATEISSPTVTLLGTGNALPAPLKLTGSMLTPNGGLYQLTPYEGMRVSVDSLTSISGTDGSLTSESTETQKSNGQFYAVLTGIARPFREPGIDIRDTPPSGAPANIDKFDDNPERILVDSTFLGGAAIDLSTGAVLKSVTGILDFTYSADSYYDPSRLLLDSTYSSANVTPGMTVQPVAAAASTEFTVAAFNVARFYNTNSADNSYYNPVTSSAGNSSAVNVTQDAYNRRLAKVSLAVRNVLNFPDIVSLEEVENQTVADDIARQISADAVAAGQADPKYVAYGTGTQYAPYTNDVGGISIGFLVKSTRVNALSVDQHGQSDLMTDPRDTSKQQTLNDRPPLVLHAGIRRDGAKDYPVTVISNHLRSLSGINDPSSGIFVRTKKELQAEYLARLIQQFQATGEHVVSVGDYNVFEFSDGLTDVMATVTGQGVLAADHVVQPGVAGLVQPSATDLVTLLPAAQRWSYQEFGNAQVLDHVVATSDLVAAGAHLAIAHLNADFPVISYNDVTTPARVSDHDVPVGYFAVPAPSLTGALTPLNADFGNVLVSVSSSGQGFQLSNTGEGTLSITGITASGDFAQSNNCGSTLAVGAGCNVNIVFTPTAPGTRTGTLSIATSAASGTFTAVLSGKGVAPVLPSLSPAALDFGSNALNVSSAPKTVTVTNNAAIAVPVSVSITGDYSQTNTCGVSIPASSTCAVAVAFKPAASGTRTGTLTVTTSGAAAATLSSTLTGAGQPPDFTLADSKGAASTSLTIAGGIPGTVNLTFAPVYGFNGTVTITCTPSTQVTGLTCAPPSPFLLSGSAPVTQTVTFTATPRTAAAGIALRSGRSPWSAAPAFVIASVLMLLASRSRRLGRAAGLLALAMAVLLPGIGCGSDGPRRSPNGTPAGSYTYTVTATSGQTTHAEAVTVTVQ